MTTTPASHAIQYISPPAARTDIPDLVEAIGTEAFGPRLVTYLNALCGADHCAVFRLGQGRLDGLTASSVDPVNNAGAQLDLYVNREWWRKDPAIHEAQQCLSQTTSRVIHLDLSARSYSELRPAVFPHVSDRLLVCGRRNEIALGLSVVRSDPHAEFAPRAVDDLAGVSGLLVSLLAKHAEILAHRPNPALALATLEEIEGCVSAMTDLPRREGEVCARVLYGMSTAGIAVDLGVGEESVKTYRKRAYQRLRMGSERELLNWYLGLWSAWRGHFHSQPATRASTVAHH